MPNAPAPITATSLPFTPAPPLGAAFIQWPAGPGHRIKIINQPAFEPFDPGPGDHGAVIGAERGRRDHQPQAGFCCRALQGMADRAIGADAAGNDQRAGLAEVFPEMADADAGAVNHAIHDGCLERGAEISHILIIQRLDGFGGEPHGGFEPGEREIRVWLAEERAGQLKTARDRHPARRFRRPGHRESPGSASWRPCRKASPIASSMVVPIRT